MAERARGRLLPLFMFCGPLSSGEGRPSLPAAARWAVLHCRDDTCSTEGAAALQGRHVQHGGRCCTAGTTCSTVGDATLQGRHVQHLSCLLLHAQCLLAHAVPCCTHTRCRRVRWGWVVGVVAGVWLQVRGFGPCLWLAGGGCMSCLLMGFPVMEDGLGLCCSMKQQVME